MAGKRWDWHMNDVQKDVIRVFMDDDVVSTTTLRFRLLDKGVEDSDITRKYMVRLVKRGLLKEVSHNVWKLTAKGKAAAADARKEMTDARIEKATTRKNDDHNLIFDVRAWLAKSAGGVYLRGDVHPRRDAAL